MASIIELVMAWRTYFYTDIEIKIELVRWAWAWTTHGMTKQYFSIRPTFHVSNINSIASKETIRGRKSAPTTGDLEFNNGPGKRS